jgi:transcriptional regulator with XRE-family HTH domain
MSETDTTELAGAAETQLLDHSEDDRRLGSCLRAIRKERALSIQTLADRCGLSIGMLSQVERGLSTPSIRSLRLLSIALDVPISRFFAHSDEEVPIGSPYILRKAARSSLRLTPTGVRKESLTPLGDGVLELYELTLAPGGTSGPEFYSHGGEKAGLVTFGVMRLWLEEEPHLLGEGDSFRFYSQISHRFDNPTREPAGVLWIVSTR